MPLIYKLRVSHFFVNGCNNDNPNYDSNNITKNNDNNNNNSNTTYDNNNTVKNDINNNTETCTYYIAGHSTARGMTIFGRINIPKNICVYTLAITDSLLTDQLFQIFNQGLLNKNLLDNLIKLSFNDKSNTEINGDLKELEKKIIVSGLFNMYTSNNNIKYLHPFFAGILVNFKNNDKVIDESYVLNFMDTSLLSIIEKICKDNDVDTNKIYSDTEIKKLTNKFIDDGGSVINSLALPFKQFLLKEKTKLLNKNYTYYDFFKDFTNVELRRYTKDNTIYNYDFYVDDDDYLYGVIKAPVKNLQEKSKELKGDNLKYSILTDLWKNRTKPCYLDKIFENYQKNIRDCEKTIFILKTCNKLKNDYSTSIFNNFYQVDEPTEFTKRERANSLSYKQKYLKYKSKYLNLK